VKTLGEVGEFLPKSKRQASYGNKEGIYPFYTSSQTCKQFCDTYDYENECLIIGTGGNANIKYSGKFACSTDNFVIKIKDGQISKYVYYYLSCNIDILQKGFQGVGLQHISKQYTQSIKIPIPSLERQQQIVEYLDFIYEKANKTNNEKILELKMLNKFCLRNQKIFGDNNIKTLGEVCNFQNGFSFKSIDYEKQNDTNVGLLQIKSIQNGVIDYNKMTEFIVESKKFNSFEVKTGDILIALSGATTGKIGLYNLEQKTYLNQRVGKINAKTGIHQKYIYYWYDNCDIYGKVLNLAQGTAQPNISTNDISNIKIYVPSIERQQEIIEYCESNERLILQLKSEIEKNIQQAQQFITNVMIKESNSV
jgi:type I restriction enzyme S subunit